MSEKPAAAVTRETPIRAEILGPKPLPSIEGKHITDRAANEVLRNPISQPQSNLEPTVTESDVRVSELSTRMHEAPPLSGNIQRDSVINTEINRPVVAPSVPSVEDDKYGYITRLPTVKERIQAIDALPEDQKEEATSALTVRGGSVNLDDYNWDALGVEVRNERDLTGLRRSLERLSPEELEGMPKLEVVFDNICNWYRLSESDRFNTANLGKLNKNFQYFIEYTVSAKEDPRLVQMEVALLNKAREVFSSQGGRNVENRLAEIQYGNFDEKLQVVIGAVSEQARAADPLHYQEFQELEEERMMLRSLIGTISPDIIRELDINEANGSRAGQLNFLKGKIDDLDINDQGKRDLKAAIDTLTDNYSHHPVMIELGAIMEGRDKVVQEIVAEGVKLPEKVEIPVIETPDRPFDEALQVFISEEEFNHSRQVLEARGIDPDNLGVVAPDPDVDRYVAQLEAKRDIETYYKIVERIGLLDEESDNAHVDFNNLRKHIQQGDTTTQREKLRIISSMGTDWASNIELEWQILGPRYARKAGLDDRVRVNGFTPDKLNGFLLHYRTNVNNEILNYLDGVHNLPGQPEKPFKEWNVNEVLAAEAREREHAEGALWRIGYSGLYEVLINSTDLSLYRAASESWLNSLVKTGVIDREPSTLMQKASYFTEALVGKAVEMASTLPEGERAVFMDKIKNIKYAFNVEIYAYCGELFNHAFNIQNLSAIYQRMNNFIEGMDHWKVAMQLREGQVYGVYLSQEDPEFEWMWRMMGPNGQLSREYAVQIRAHSMMKDRLADKRVGEVIWDRHRRSVDGSEGEVWDVGETAREKNLDLLGLDRSKKETVRAFVPKNDELFDIADKNRLWMSDWSLQALDQLLNGRTVAEGMRDRAIAQKVFELAFTPEEKKALELRDIKARQAEKNGILHSEDRSNILIFNKNVNGSFRELSDVENLKYKEAFASAKDAVDIYMQLISMTGDKARETGPSYVCRATNEQGELVPFLDQAVEMDKIPKWRLKRLTTYAKNIAARKIAEHNIRIEREAAALTDPKDAAEKRKAKILRGSDKYKAIMGDPTNPKLIDQNAMDQGHHGGHHGEHGHAAHGPWGGDVSHFRDEIGSAVWMTLDAAFKQGWSLKLKDFEINDHGELEFGHDTMKFIEKNDDTGIVETKEVTFYTIEKHPLAQSMKKTYDAHQLDQMDYIASEENKARSQAYLDGRLSKSEAGVAAMQLLSIDPALNRLTPLDDLTELNRYVLAQIEESALNSYDIERAMAREFRGFIEWGYMSMMTTGLRRLINMSEYIMTQDKNTPRAEWLGPFANGYTDPLGDSYALPHSFESVKLIKRKSPAEESAKQEALDPPELEASAGMYNIGMEIYSIWLGTDKDPGTMEKPTVSNENLTADVYERNESRPMDKNELREAGLPSDAHVEIAKSISHQLELQKKLLEALGRIKPLFDPTLNKMSRNLGADGASDIRQTETWEYDGNGNIVFENGVPKQLWRLDAFDANGLRASEGIGRGRHETTVVAKAFTTWAKSFQLKDEKGRLAQNGQEYNFNGGVREYADAAFWLRHLGVYLKVQDLPKVDQESLPEYLKKKRYITFEEFVINKWSRR